MEAKFKQSMKSFLDAVTVHVVLRKGSKKEILELLQYKIASKCIDENGDTLLHGVLRNKNLHEIEIIEISTLFRNQCVSPNVKNKHGETFLHLAVARRMKKVVDFFIKSNCNIHITDDFNNTIAHFFIKDENLKCKLSKFDKSANHDKMKNESVNFLKFLISKNLNFDCVNDDGNSAVHLAISYHLQHLLPTLFEHTNDINFFDKNDETLLELLLGSNASARKKQFFLENSYSGYNSNYATRSVQILFERGIPILTNSKHGCTLLSKAIMNKECMSIIEILVNNYLINCKDSKFATFMFHLIINTCEVWNESDSMYFLTVLSDLIDKGADVSGNDEEGNRPVHAAMLAKYFHVVEFLKKHRADFSLRTKYNQNVLHLLAEQKMSAECNRDFYSEVWYFMKYARCNVNDKCKRGRTPLHAAAANGNVQMIQALLDYGAEINCQDTFKRTPLHEALMTDNPKELIELLLKNGANVDAVDFSDYKPLHLAASNANASVVQLLIEHGAVVNYKNKKHMETALHRVSTNPDAMQIVPLLLKYGADVNVKDVWGNTPPHRVLNHLNPNSKRIMRVLLKNGTYVNTPNLNGTSILFRALTRNQTGMLRVILKYCADLNEPYIRQLIPEIQASRNKDAIDFLLSKQMIKLTTAQIPFSSEYEDYVKNYQGIFRDTIYDECLKEIEELKSIFIDKYTSLYHFIHKRPQNAIEYINNEKLQQFIKCPTFNSQYINYSPIIQDNYQQAIIRKYLLDRATEAWYKLTKGMLPDSIDYILAYLTNVDLSCLIKAREHVDVA